MKFLIIAPAWVGDMVMAQTLFKLLKQTHADVSIDVVAPPSTFSLLARMPEVRQAFKLSVGHGGLQLKVRYALGKRLRQEKYEQAIVLPNSWKSALVPFFARIPKRTGWRGEWRYGLLNDVRTLNKEKLPLMIQRFCALGLLVSETLPEKLAWPKLCIDEENQKALMEKFRFTQSHVLAICPGAEYGPSKRWPPEFFAEVAKDCLKKGGQVWILGGSKDQEVAEKIQVLCDQQCMNFVGQTALPDAVDLLGMASVVLTNDSGLMHIAAAVDVPVVAVYGSTSPDFTPPLSHKVKVLSLKLACSPCFERTCRFGHYHCLTQLLPKQVLEAFPPFFNVW